MSQIEKSKSFKAKNLLSLRKKITQSQANEEMNKIAAFLEGNGIKQSGPVITATFAVDKETDDPLIDMEILVPMDRKTNLPEEYSYKEVIHIVNAVHATHRGRPDTLYSTYNDLFKYIKENNLQQITAVYNAYIKDHSPMDTSDNLIIDVYIGVNPSIL